MSSSILSIPLLFISFVLSSNSFASYRLKNIKLTDYEFSRYIKPQLNSISQEYYNLLSLLNPEFKNVKGTFYLSRDIYKLSLSLSKVCSNKNNPSCISLIDGLIKKTNQIISLNSSYFVLNKKKFLSGQSFINSLISYNNFFGHIMNLNSKLRDFKYFYFSEINFKQTMNLEKSILETINLYNLYLLHTSDNRFKQKFTSYWNGFIRPVNEIILPLSDKNHFIRKINDFNIKWNELNVQLTKKNKPISKQVKTLLKVMHNRWNNILKVSLR